MKVGKLAEVRVRVSAARYGNPARDMNIVLVVGDYAKTTVATLFAGIAEEAGKSTAYISREKTPGFDASIESVFKTLSQVKKDQRDFVIIEATDKLLSLGVMPQVSIGTLILTSNHEKAEELLRSSPRHVVAPSDLSVPEGLIEPYKHISFGEDESAEAQLTSVKLYKKGTELSVAIDHQIRLKLATHLVGKANARNALTATATAYILGFDTSLIQEGIADIEQIPGNFVRTDTDQPYETYYDEGSSIDSIMLAVESAKELARRRLIVVLCDERYSEEDLMSIKGKADRVVSVLSAERGDVSGVDRVLTKAEAIEKGKRAAKQDDLLLIFGAPEEESL